MGKSKGPRRLPANAYKTLESEETYQPYVPAGSIMPEITARSVILGVVMAIIFTAAARLGLKIGRVFEAAIPIAIRAVGMAGFFGRRSTISEHVIIQSIGSASGVVAAGMIFALPVLIILDLEMRFYQTFLAALLGGLSDFAVATFGLCRGVASTRVVPALAAVADWAKLVVKINTLAAAGALISDLKVGYWFGSTPRSANDEVNTWRGAPLAGRYITGTVVSVLRRRS